MKKFLKSLISVAVVSSMLVTSVFAATITSVDMRKERLSFDYILADGAEAMTTMVYTATEVSEGTEGAVEIDGKYYTLGENIAMDQFKTSVQIGTAQLKYAGRENGETLVLQVGDSMSAVADYEAVLLYQKWGTGIFVSNTGDDSANGEEGQPVKTIARAVEVYKEAKAEYPDVDFTIYVDGGTYQITERIDLTSDHSGMTITNYNGEDVTFTGGHSVNSIGVGATESDLGGRLPADKLSNIYKYDLSSLNLPTKQEITAAYSDKDYQDYVPELLDNGQAKTVARWPNNSWAFTGEIISTNESATPTHEFKTTAPIENITDFTNARIDGFWARDYRLSHGQITGKGNGTLKIKVDAVFGSEWRILPNERYYISNLPELLDAPGEYYIDYDSETLYYYPENPASVDMVITGVLEPNGISASNKVNSMFDLDGISNITIDGISFEDTTGTFISGKNADNLTVKNCVFKNAGGRAIYLRATTNSTITQSYFADMGDSSVEFLGCGDVATLTPSNNKVSNCEFKNGARVVGTYAAFVTMGDYENVDDISMGITAENNYFHNHMHSAIIFGGNDMIIKNNIFDNVVTHTSDAGAVYSNGRTFPYFQGNKIINNIFRNIRSFKQTDADQHTMAAAVYMDDLMPNVNLTENVFYNCEYPTSLAGGIGHTVTKNLVYDCNYGLMYTERGSLATSAKAGGDFYSGWQTISSKTGYDAEAWYAKYPKYKQLVDALVAYNLSTTDANYSDKAAHIHNAMFNQNIMVSGNTNLDYTISGSAYWDNNYFTKVAEYNTSAGTGVNEANSYYSADESEIVLDGASLSFSSTASATLKGYTLPDVSNAGILVQNEIYTMDTGRDDNNEGSGDRGNDFMIGHRSQISDFDLSASVASISAGSSVTVTFPQKVNKSFTFGLEFTGDISLSFAEGETAFANSTSGRYEYEFDMENGRVTIYKQDETTGEWSQLSSKRITIPEIVKGVNITANSASSVTGMAIGVCDDKGTPGYYYLDFEDAKTGAMIDELDENIFTNNIYAVTDARIVEESDGNKAFYFAAQNYDAAGNAVGGRDFVRNYLTFAPIKLSGNRVAVEFKVKADSTITESQYGKLLTCLVPHGYYASNPDRNVEVLLADFRITYKTILSYTYLEEHGFYIGGKRDGNALEKVTGGTEVASLSEMQQDYITVKYILDKDAKTVEIWKITDGEWEQVGKSTGYTLPDYINRLVNTIFVPNYTEHQMNERIGYTFDDIKIYNADAPLVADSSGNATSLAASKTVTINPDYVPGVRAGNLIGAVYQENSLSDADTVTLLSEDEGVTLDIPSGESTIRLFKLKNLNSLSPVSSVMILNVK